ncbi:hypothetical protein FQA39_LY11500 [Lamprigera yunnana]|nr:hypothetical protein FQA39_LY11500 [Lamprigera yunnana]
MKTKNNRKNSKKIKKQQEKYEDIEDEQQENTKDIEMKDVEEVIGREKILSYLTVLADDSYKNGLVKLWSEEIENMELEINTNKIKMMIINNNEIEKARKIEIKANTIEIVTAVEYLGPVITDDGRTYGSEALTINKKHENEKRNEGIRKKIRQEGIMDFIERKQLRWYGHIIRKDEQSLLKQIIESTGEEIGTKWGKTSAEIKIMAQRLNLISDTLKRYKKEEEDEEQMELSYLTIAEVHRIIHKFGCSAGP